MDNSRLQPEQRSRELFLQAIDIDCPTARARFVDTACGADETLRLSLRQLLKASESDDQSLDPEQYAGLNQLRADLFAALSAEGKAVAELGTSVKTLAGRYLLVEELGRGTTGTVYRARQTDLKRDVAVKVLICSSLASPGARERFRIEAEAAACLDHPHIVPIFEFGQDSRYDFFSMALFRKGTLGQKMSQQILGQRTAALLMMTIAHAVQAAHQHGIIHRDLKPDNILMDESGSPHVSDFGLASRLEQTSSMTMTGQIMGTPQYMAPEQASAGETQVSTLADIYSMGAILYEMVTGEPVFQGDSVLQILEKVKAESPRLPRTHDSGIDRDMETIIMKCLEKTPSERYDSAADLAADLEAWLGGRPISARPPGAAERIVKWSKRRPLHASLGVLISLFLLTLGIGGPVVALRESRLRDEADVALQLAQQERQAADQERRDALVAQASAEQSARELRSLAYAYSTRLAGSMRDDDGSRLISNSILRALTPASGEPDNRDWEWYFAHATALNEPQITEAQSSAVQAVRFSPDGSVYAVSFEGIDGSWLRDGMHHAPIRSLRDKTGSHLQIVWSRDGKRVLTVSSTGVARIWDARDASQIVTLPKQSPTISLSWHEPSQRVVALTADNAIRVWRITDDKQVHEISKTPANVPALKQIALSPDAQYVAGFTGDKLAHLWRLDALTETPMALVGHEDSVTNMSWHHDSHWLATRSADGDARIWEVPHGALLSRFGGNGFTIGSFTWAPNGQQILYFDSTSFRLINHQIASDHDPGGQLVASYRKKRSRTISSDRRKKKQVTSLDWSGPTHAAVIGFADGSVELRRIGLPKAKTAIGAMNYSEKKSLSSVSWSSDSADQSCLTDEGQILTEGPLMHRILRTSDPILIYHWDPAGKENIAYVTTDDMGHTLYVGGTKFRDLSGIMLFSDPGLISISWAKAGNVLAALSRDGRISVWNVENGTRSKTLLEAGEVGSVDTAICFSPVAQVLLATGHPKRIALFDVESGKSDVIPLGATTSPPVTQAWHPAGELFATGHADGNVLIWNRRTRKQVQKLWTDRTSAPAMAWHPSGDRIAISGPEHSIDIWDWKLGKSVYRLVGHEGDVNSLAWDSDGRRLASTGLDDHMRRWDATAGYFVEQRRDVKR